MHTTTPCSVHPNTANYSVQTVTYWTAEHTEHLSLIRTELRGKFFSLSKHHIVYTVSYCTARPRLLLWLSYSVNWALGKIPNLANLQLWKPSHSVCKQSWCCVSPSWVIPVSCSLLPDHTACWELSLGNWVVNHCHGRECFVHSGHSTLCKIVFIDCTMPVFMRYSWNKVETVLCGIVCKWIQPV